MLDRDPVNCLLLDLTVIYLISIVHMNEIFVQIEKKFKVMTSGGRGWSVNWGTPDKKGGHKGHIFAAVLYGWPLRSSGVTTC